MLTLALGVVIDALLRVRESGWGALTRVVVGAGLVVVFGWRQRGRGPGRQLLDPAVFASRGMVAVGCVLLAVSGGYWAVLVYLPLFLGRAFGWGADVAGVALLAATLPMLVIPPFGARLAQALGWRRLFAVALGVMAVGGVGLAVAAAAGAGGVSWALIGMVCLGVGAALSHPQLSGAVMDLAPAEVGGMAAAVTVVARQGGFAFGVAMLGAVVPGDLSGVGFVWVFGVATFVSVCGVAACVWLPARMGRVG